jgi:hypothetical protein
MFPIRVGRFETILPTGLTLKFPFSGVSAEETIPAICRISGSRAVVTFTNLPDELILTKSPTAIPA